MSKPALLIIGKPPTKYLSNKKKYKNKMSCMKSDNFRKELLSRVPSSNVVITSIAFQ